MTLAVSSATVAKFAGSDRSTFGLEGLLVPADGKALEEQGRARGGKRAGLERHSAPGYHTGL